MPHFFRAFGLLIQSSLPIPGAQPANPHDPSPADLILEEGKIPQAIPDKEPGPYWRIGESLLFTMPGVARYLCHEQGTRLLIEVHERSSPEAVAAMLIATALPAILWMRGEIVLHAAAAVLPGHTKAIAFAGPSGSGKSTLLQTLLTAGATAVADDTLCLRLRRNAVQISGLPSCTFLRHPGEPNRHQIPIAGASQITHAPLGVLILLEPSENPMHPLPKLQALTALLRHRHRPTIPRLLGLEPALLHRLSSFARSFPICNYPCETLDSPNFTPNFLLGLHQMDRYLE